MSERKKYFFDEHAGFCAEHFLAHEPHREDLAVAKAMNRFHEKLREVDAEPRP